MSVFFGQVRQELEEMRKKYDEMRNKYKEMKTEVSYDSCNSVLCLFVQYVFVVRSVIVSLVDWLID